MLIRKNQVLEFIYVDKGRESVDNLDIIQDYKTDSLNVNDPNG